MAKLIKSLRNRVGQSALARNTLWMFLGQALRLVIQGGCFVVIARSLGASNYGAFIGAVSLVAIFSPFATLGFGNVLFKNVARDRSLFPQYWGNALLMSIVSGAMQLMVIAVIARFALPASIPTPLILLVAVSDVLATPVTDVACLAFQSLEQMRWTARINITLSVLRFLGAVTAVGIWVHPTALDWGVMYCAASCLCASFSIVVVSGRFGRPRFDTAKIVSELAEGFHFASGASAQTIYNDLDKTMLSRLSTLNATGIYAAAYRLIDVAFVPVRSLLGAAYPGYFRAGEQGIRSSVGYMKRLLPKAVAYALVVFVVLIVAAPLIPRILGPEYAQSVEALRWLALLPLMRTIHTFCGDALTTTGHQKLRMLFQVLVAVINVWINLWIIPRYSWRGAVWSSLASDFLLLVVMASAVSILYRETETKTVVPQYALDPGGR
jgi:O-antigen/teichoic acid export membrane protein